MTVKESFVSLNVIKRHQTTFGGMVLTRSGRLLTVLAMVSVGILGPGAAELPSHVSANHFPSALLALGSLVQLALSAWILVVIGLAHVLGTSRILGALVPRTLRRALFVGAVGSLVLTPAQAERGSSTTTPAGVHSLDGLRLPDRPATSPTAHTVVVRRGDTLWAIAARSLPAHADEAQIARECARWHTANRAVIGDDPDLIHPAQQLAPPPPDKDAS